MDLETDNLLKRKFPGPAGLLPKCTENFQEGKTVNEKLNYTSEEVISTDSLASKCSDVLWDRMKKDFCQLMEARSLFMNNNIKILQQKRAVSGSNTLWKTPFLAVSIKSISPSCVDAAAVFTDETGLIHGTICEDTLCKYGDFISVGSVLLLKDAVVLSPVPLQRRIASQIQRQYLYITSYSILKIYFKSYDNEICVKSIVDITPTLVRSMLASIENEKDMLNALENPENDLGDQLLNCDELTNPVKMSRNLLNMEKSLKNRTPDSVPNMQNNFLIKTSAVPNKQNYFRNMSPALNKQHNIQNNVFTPSPNRHNNVQNELVLKIQENFPRTTPSHPAVVPNMQNQFKNRTPVPIRQLSNLQNKTPTLCTNNNLQKRSPALNNPTQCRTSTLVPNGQNHTSLVTNGENNFYNLVPNLQNISDLKCNATPKRPKLSANHMSLNFNSYTQKLSQFACSTSNLNKDKTKEISVSTACSTGNSNFNNENFTPVVDKKCEQQPNSSIKFNAPSRPSNLFKISPKNLKEKVSSKFLSSPKSNFDNKSNSSSQPQSTPVKWKPPYANNISTPQLGMGTPTPSFTNFKTRSPNLSILSKVSEKQVVHSEGLTHSPANSNQKFFQTKEKVLVSCEGSKSNEFVISSSSNINSNSKCDEFSIPSLDFNCSLINSNRNKENNL